MNINMFTDNPTQKTKISSVEAYNLWNTLRVRYNSVETYKLYQNFVHDKDLGFLMNNHQEVFKKQINLLEKKMKEYNVKLPSRPPAKLKFTTAIDAITDELIFRRLYRDLHTELLALSRTITSSTVNDNLRQLFRKFFIKHLDIYEDFYKYGKVKGWTEIAPAYKTSQPVRDERLSVSEANHIEDHVNLRYDQKNMTQYFWTFTNDPDLKKILELGLNKLNEQINKLEKTAEKYEIPLPDRPPVVHQGTADPEIIEDKFIFRTIFAAIQNAVDMHIRAVVEATRNDKVRELFLNLLQIELNIFDNFLKYGKLKGWTHVITMYRNKT